MTVDQSELNDTYESGANGGHIIQDAGTPVTDRANLNFTGAGVTVSDDAGNDRTTVTIAGGGGGSAFALDRMLVVNPDIAEVVGVNYQSYANAIAYATTTMSPSPSATDKATILITGATSEAIAIYPHVNVLGINNSTRLTGAVTVDSSVTTGFGGIRS